MKEWLKNNKFILVISLLFIISLFYCSLNTFIVNDDLGYSFFYRTNTRITNIIQVIKNQISDYMIVSPRVFIHAIVQFLLIFEKNLWAILNPIMILINGILISKIVLFYHKNSSKAFNILVYLISFILIISFKWLIYWVAGSVNYVWTSTVLFGFIYYYLKNKFTNKYIINFLVILFVSILHESLFIFMVVFILSKIAFDFIINKKVDKKDLLLFIPLIISGCFLFLGPGMQKRLGSNENINLFKQIITSLPIISSNLFGLFNKKNIIPTLFIIIFLIKILKSNSRYKYYFSGLLILNIILVLLLNNNWLYFSLGLLIILISFYLNYQDKRNDLSLIVLSYYAVSYSLCLTNEYLSGRPNYFFFIYLIFMMIIYFNDIIKIRKAYIGVLLVILISLLINEIAIYKEIGKIKEIRLQQIKEYKKNATGILTLKEVPEKYYPYQMDSNEPQSYYYAYKYYLNYYGLKDDTVIEFRK